MSRCINCVICVQRLHRHAVSELALQLQTILMEWLDLPQLPHDAVLCHACYVILHDDENEPRPLRRLGHTQVCIGCGSSVLSTRNYILDENSPLLNVFPTNFNIPGHRHRVCTPCWLRGNRRVIQDEGRIDMNPPLSPEPPVPQLQGVPPMPNPPPPEPRPRRSPTIVLPNYKRAANTSSHCVYSMCPNVATRLVPSFVKVFLIKEHCYYVPRSARACETHLSDNVWHTLPDINALRNISEFTPAQVEDIINLMKTEITFDFNQVEEMPHHICHYWTGLTVIEFLSLFNELVNIGNFVKSPKQSLAWYLTKLRTGDSNDRLASLFQTSAATFQRRTKEVREYLVSEFIPLYIGLQHMTRQDVAERNLLIPNALFGRPESNLEERPAIVICDGTYIYIEKSSNYLYQKLTYSLHKFYNLVKPFLIVCTDGHILDVVGPYGATQTDAEIMIDLFRDADRPMRSFFREDDCFILDRGFRDAIPLLEECQYNVYKPEGISDGETQLTTLQANQSRCVTLCRWVVEVVNGRFKRDFKIFRQDFFNTAHKHLMDDFKVAAALINRFHPLITDRPDATLIVDRALRYLNQPNHLAEYISRFNLNRRRVMFTDIDGHLPQLQSFPRLSRDELILISLGTYQVKQARSYYGEHIRGNGIYQIQVCPQLEHSAEMITNLGGSRPYLLRAKIKSRHISQRKYFSYVLYETDTSVQEQSPIDRILGYYCSCLVGNRTVGCCCHVMTVIWYLAWARYEDNITAPAMYLDDILIEIED